MFLCTAPILLLPVASYADGAEKIVEDVVQSAKENPGKASGLAGCAAILIFPPAAIWCAATLVGGVTYDGDTQKLLEEVTK
jgi:hypothetical protein